MGETGEVGSGGVSAGVGVVFWAKFICRSGSGGNRLVLRAEGVDSMRRWIMEIHWSLQILVYRIMMGRGKVVGVVVRIFCPRYRCGGRGSGVLLGGRVEVVGWVWEWGAPREEGDWGTGVRSVRCY